jgi:hypothetical protein
LKSVPERKETNWKVFGCNIEKIYILNIKKPKKKKENYTSEPLLNQSMSFYFYL